MLKRVLTWLLVVAMVAPFGVALVIMGRTFWAHASGQLVYGGASTSVASAAGDVQTACPFGLVNDPYPGACRRYVDRNNNGICDLSEIPADGAVVASEACEGHEEGAAGAEGGQGMNQETHEVGALVAAQGRVVVLEPELEIVTAQGQMHIGMGPLEYREAQGFAPRLGDELYVIGFDEDGELKAIEVWNLTTGEKVQLRDLAGRPMWSGQGKGRNH